MKIHFSSLLKQCRPGFHQKGIVVEPFGDPIVCPVKTLRQYLEGTNTIRPGGVDSLLISISRPHKPVARDTVHRWLVYALVMVGVDGSTAHSFRSASTSVLARNGVVFLCIRFWSELDGLESPLFDLIVTCQCFRQIQCNFNFV